jgi:hypothetical protein
MVDVLMSVWLVLTMLGNVLVFAQKPTVYDGRKGWQGRVIYPLDPPVVEALRFDEVLTRNEPREFRMDESMASAWTILRSRYRGLELVSFARELNPKCTFCWRGVRALDVQAVPLGEHVSMVFA